MSGLFGKKLFTKKKAKKETHLYDFAQHGNASGQDVLEASEFIEFVSDDGLTKTSKEKTKKSTITPKELYKLGTLNQSKMAIKCDSVYVKAEQEKLRKKLSLIRGDSGGSRYGRLELTSMIERLENRRHFSEFEGVINEYPHTTSAAINDVINAHSNLRFKEASEFIPDMPDDAVAAMEDYRQMCQALCDKDPVFYIVADKKDFGEKDRRRDPILLAQSPFGFIWQILGAWDEEMIYLGDL